MRVWRWVSGGLFVLGVCLFGLHLTAADGASSASDLVLYALFGSNNRYGVACTDGQATPCGQKALTHPNGAVEIVDLSTTPPSRLKSIDLGATVPTSLAVAPDGSKLYFVDSYHRNVQTVDAATGAFLQTVYVPEGPLDAVLSPEGRILYVTTRKPSVIAIDLVNGIKTGEIVPNKPFPENLGGIAFSREPGGDRLAVAATCGNPALYLLDVQGSAITLQARLDFVAGCDAGGCAGSDDAAFTDLHRALLANLNCREIYQANVGSGLWVSNSTVMWGDSSCLPLNPQNSLLFSPLSHKAYVVWRGFHGGDPAALTIVNPDNLATAFISDFAGIPEAAALTPDGRTLLIIKQDGYTSPTVLDSFDTLTAAHAAKIYTFSSFVGRRGAIDAKVLEKSTVFAMVHGGAGWSWPKGTARDLGGLALALFGLVLWRRDRRG
jgi:hypothetical protein